jgi:hypothetical protein
MKKVEGRMKKQNPAHLGAAVLHSSLVIRHYAA